MTGIHIEVVFELAALRKLRGVDCPTPKCLANAYGTGRIVRRSDCKGLFVELNCPDCDLLIHSLTPDAQALCDALVAAAPSERDAICERWVAPRIGDVHPLRSRPPSAQ